MCPHPLAMCFMQARILATPTLWNVAGRPLSLTHRMHAWEFIHSSTVDDMREKIDECRFVLKLFDVLMLRSFSEFTFKSLGKMMLLLRPMAQRLTCMYDANRVMLIFLHFES